MLGNLGLLVGLALLIVMALRGVNIFIAALLCAVLVAVTNGVSVPKALLVDKGNDGDRFRESLLVRGILPIIPPRANRKVPEHPDYRRYKDRNRVERLFSKLKQQRRIATRYDKTLLSFESFLNLAAVRLWLKSFVNAT